MTLGTISTTLGMIPRTLGAVATTIEMISMTVAAIPTTLGTAPTTLGTIPMTLGTVPTTKETSATVKETPSRVTEMTPSWQVMGGGKREFHRAKDAKAAKSQRDAMTIAQPFMAGSGVNQVKKSREGRQKNRVGCPQWWPCASTFRPWRDFGRWRASSPSHEWLGYFQRRRSRVRRARAVRFPATRKRRAGVWP